MRWVLLGPPGAGKGTQAARLSRERKMPHVSTGDILREAMAVDSPLGRQAREFVERGELVPDDVIVGLVGERLEQDDCADGFLLDGFPRTGPQAEALDALLKKRQVKLDGVLYFRASRRELVDRLSGRRLCRACGANYHQQHLPPKRDGVCDRCGGPLYQREDDQPQAIENRLLVYEQRTKDLVDYYRRQGLLREVPAEQGIDDVWRAVCRWVDVAGD